MGLFSKKEKKELALVFDVRSSSVGGALFLMQKSGVPEIIYSIREPIPLEEKIDFDRLLFLTTKAIERVASRICLAGLGAPSQVFCVLASPWYASQTRTIKLEKNAPFVFTSKLADSLTQKEINLFKKEHLEKYSHAKNKLRLIELKHIKTTLNGYAISEPVGQKTKELEMTIFIGVAEEQALKKIEEEVGKHFYTDIKFSSFSMASFAVARDLFAYQEDFLLIDIGGELTDISIVKKDVLLDSVSFPMGRNFMMHGVSHALECSLDEAKFLISIYKDSHADKSTEKKLQPIINKLKSEWLKKFQESLFNLSNNTVVPATIFVNADLDLADFFVEIIKAEQFNQYFLTTSKFSVV